MQSLRTRSRGAERGAYLAWFAVIATTLVGFGAIVIDVGALYYERRQLQNGADAAALAVAQECVASSCPVSSSTYGLAEQFSDNNAKDGQHEVTNVCGAWPGLAACADPPSVPTAAKGYVRVRNRTNNPSNSSNQDQVRFLLAPVLNAAHVGQTVHSSAVAAWGTPKSASATPLVIGLCEYTLRGGIVGDATTPAQLPTGSHYISLNGSPLPCADGTSGGFGWANVSSNGCQLYVPLASGGYYPVAGDPGAAIQGGCNLKYYADNKVPILVPIFHHSTDSGNNLVYSVMGFAGFIVEKYRIPSESGSPYGNPDCKLNTYNGVKATANECIYGHFAPITVSDGEMGDGFDFGARVISMVG